MNVSSLSVLGQRDGIRKGTIHLHTLYITYTRMLGTIHNNRSLNMKYSSPHARTYVNTKHKKPSSEEQGSTV